MAFLKKRHKIAVGVLIVIVLLFVNAFVFPFRTADPNYSDVERVFNRMQFPADWQEVRSSENRGLFGRKCPIEPGSRCFQKGKTFSVPEDTEYATVEKVFKHTGCLTVSIYRSEPIDGTPYANFECSTEGLTVDGGITEKNNQNWEVSIYVST